MKNLLHTRGFVAFIAVAFLNAFVDLGHKIIIQNTLFKSFDGHQQIILTAIVNGLILLPFILAFTPAGFCSDRFAKNKVMRISAVLAVIVTCAITWCYYQGLFNWAFGLTFVLALQSAFYSPAKYGYIRDLLGTNRLSEGNSWLQGITMLAIMLGIVAFSLVFEILLPQLDQYTPQQVLPYIAPLGYVLVACSLLELAFTLRLPTCQASDEVPEQSYNLPKFNWHHYLKGRSLLENLRLLATEKAIWQSVIGLTIFWSIAQMLLAVFPAFAKDELQLNNTFLIQSMMGLSGVGIIIGSVMVNRMSRNQINLALIPVGIIIVTAALLALPQSHDLFWISSEFFLIGLGGSMFCIPLNALIQFHALPKQLGLILAGNNFVQNIGMITFLALTVAVSILAFNIHYLLWGLAILAIITSLAAFILLPEALLRGFVSALLSRKYRLKVLGLKHLQQTQQGGLLLGNHISWLDWAMVQMACPRHIHFVMDETIYNRWYLKWFFDLYKVIPISPRQNRHALEQITELLNQNKVVCLFPEGQISHLGQLSEFKRGFEKACLNAHGVIIPFYLRGMWGSFFSRSSHHLAQLRRSGLKRDVVIAFGEPIAITSSHHEVKQRVFDLSVKAWNEYTDTLESLAEVWVQTAKAKPTPWALADSTGTPQSHHRLLTMSAMMQRRFKRLPGQNIGLLVPTSSVGIMSNIASLMAGKTIVNINYSASLDAQLNALEQADIQSIVTAHKFVDKLSKRGCDIETLFKGKKIFYLEEFQQHIRPSEKISTLLAVKLLPTSILRMMWCIPRQLDDTAAILFSSGSEGNPKGIMLSHRNLMANIRQVSDVLNVTEQDRVMATLPLFHAFGLTVTGLMPLLEGIPAICHPDPTDGLRIARAVVKYQATFMCATSTFLRLYARNNRIHPLMFASLRAVISGAEKLDPSVRDSFLKRFGKNVLEGYGTTETTPVASVNLPDHIDPETAHVQEASRPGTVGMALPGTTFRIVDPDTLEALPTGEDGQILIGGAQIMKGYLNNPELTSESILDIDGLRWFKTGDKGHLDEDGYLTIVDRYSRFAKLGGEMVSLGAVERYVHQAIPDLDCPIVAVSVPDPKKGEKLVLLFSGEMTAQTLRQHLIDHEVPSLMLPSEIMAVDELPMLGSGKVDFKAAKSLALELQASN